jgi:hypothetical protein
MTVKEKILNAGMSDGVYTAEDFIRRARPALFEALSDAQKHDFIRMARAEQEAYLRAMLSEMKIRIPKYGF